MVLSAKIFGGIGAYVCFAKELKSLSAKQIIQWSHIVVALTYCKGVVLCEKYDRMNSLYFKGLIEREFAC